MLFPVTSNQYGKDFKRIVQSPKFNNSEYLTVLSLLIAGKKLPAKYANHPLSGTYNNFWDCHITNDCVLIYRIIENDLYLVRIGTHSEVFKK
jgi:mRNA interferase YafQ